MLIINDHNTPLVHDFYDQTVRMLYQIRMFSGPRQKVIRSIEQTVIKLARGNRRAVPTN